MKTDLLHLKTICFLFMHRCKLEGENHICEREIQTGADQRDTAKSHDHTAQTTCLSSHLQADPGVFPHTLLCGDRQMEAHEMNEGAVNHSNMTR